MVKCVSILGSTGSIGRQSLDIISRLPGIRVAALTAGTSVARMAEQCRAFQPELAVMATCEAAQELAQAIKDLPVRVSWGEKGLIEASTIPEADCVITAVVGMVGLKPTLAAIREGKRIGLANKETLVVAGALICQLAQKYHAPILPVDSEHSAIFQCLLAAGGNRFTRIHLTASGGPFRTWEKDRIAKATRNEALKHPQWTMGAKITIDSATMMNKGFEMIEACWLFNTGPEKINIVIHPQSVIHSMVEFEDGAVLAQMGHPDMREPIQFALSFPERLALDNRKLDFASVGSLTFEKPDTGKFPCLELAFEAIKKGGNIPCAMNAANEAAVAAYLEDRIGFYDIPDIISRCMGEVSFIRKPDIGEILSTNDETYARAAEMCRQR